MSGKESLTPLTKILTQPGYKGSNIKYVDIIRKEEIPIFCLNQKTHKNRLMPFKTLFDNNEDFWHQDQGWEYFFMADGYKKLQDQLQEKPIDWDKKKQELESNKAETVKPVPEIIESEEDLEELEELEASFGEDYKTFSEMTSEEKINLLNQDKDKLNALLEQKNKDEAEVVEVLIDTTKNAALINHTALEDAIIIADNEAKKLTQGLVDSTHEMVKSSAQLISQDIFSNELMTTLVEKSNGTVIQHMTRVYLNGIAFLSYYNKLVSTSSAIQKIRVKFASQYRKFYKDLLPHLDDADVNLEHVFYGGLRVIPPDLFNKWAVGFLIHDIGKAGAVEYHEGEASYDRKIVIDHVKQGYKSIMTKTNYPMEASLITGYHHEYYGDPAGYGYFRAYLAQYKKQNPYATQDYCITFDLEPILDYQALAYFPAKVLEIIDVFDSVTDPHRVYRKPMTTDEAITMMREEFVEKNHKVDLILFDIFSAFIKEKEKANKFSKK